MKEALSDAELPPEQPTGIYRVASEMMDLTRLEEEASNSSSWLKRGPVTKNAQTVAPVVWFTGLSGSGKSTLCRELEKVLTARGDVVRVLDADELRKTLCADLGFDYADRVENIQRISLLAATLANNGVTALVAAIAPYRVMRRNLRAALPRYIEVYVDTPLATCIARDPKGLYLRSMAGKIRNFTGISDPYEIPELPDVVCSTDNVDVNCTLRLLLEAFDAVVERQQTGVYAAR